MTEQPIEQPFTLDQMASPPRRRKLWPYVVAAVLVLALAAAGGLGWWLTRPGPEVVRETGATLSAVVAAGHTACEEAVKERLKAPGTAKFGGRGERRTSGSDGWEFVGYVDAENSFGGNVRNRYVCSAFKGDTGWRVYDVTFSDWP